jgi:hypothetical protein
VDAGEARKSSSVVVIGFTRPLFKTKERKEKEKKKICSFLFFPETSLAPSSSFFFLLPSRTECERRVRNRDEEPSTDGQRRVSNGDEKPSVKKVGTNG